MKQGRSGTGKFSGREKLLFVTPFLVLLLALAPGQISNHLFRYAPDGLVIDNVDVNDMVVVRVAYEGHPNAIFTIKDVPAGRQKWCLFDHHKMIERSSDWWEHQKSCWLRVEGFDSKGNRIGTSYFYPATGPKPLTRKPLKLIVHVGSGTWWPQFQESRRSENESFWRDLGDALLRRSQESAA